MIGAYAIVLGLIALGGAFWLPFAGHRFLLGLTGLVSIFFGVVMFSEPGTRGLAVLALIAAYALITGLTELAIAVGGLSMFTASPRTAQ